MKLIEKKRERERARREIVEEDVQFKTTMGELTTITAATYISPIFVCMPSTVQGFSL